ncbi:uncharacterized protein LOC121372320 [Gigantopelta aegis]|uniref:uncharacterized protein LOC121372320 n=1 Tax=Gigantopelta aegis TaxID=1735272 RepID=UPI001B88ACEB|nr:uncharacterized protein LOC121372320 [Gigantopelta aegis]
MARLTVALFFVLAVVSVWGEECSLGGSIHDWRNECSHERCHHSHGAVIGCVSTPHSASGKGICTCVTRCDDDVSRCHVKNDCIRSALLNRCGQCQQGDHDYHCIDNHCHCGFPTKP